MATVKGTQVIYGIAGGLKTSGGAAVTGVAAVTSVNATGNSETKRIKGNNGNTQAFVLCNNTTEVTATVVTANTVELPAIGSVLQLDSFTASGINDKYFVTNADMNFSNESEMTMTVSLINFPSATFTNIA
tara:strand:+ start:5073 stop:5465 length:393 start_codon:yes stop_codon:yes gene_type:complete